MPSKSLLALLAILFLAGIATATRPVRNPFLVEGRVFCDTCKAGFETPKSTYIAGAKVRIECRDRKSNELIYSREGYSNSNGTYSIYVNEDHEDELCDTVLVSSPDKKCKTPCGGRDRARIVLTNYNGMVSNKRFANNMGFENDEAEDGCAELLRQYALYDDEN